MRNKILSAILILTVCVSTVSGVWAADKGYIDTSMTKYEKAVGLLQALKIAEGFSDGTFEVNEVMTRAEFAEILTGLTCMGDLTSDKVYFKDVKATHPSKDAINIVCTSGYMDADGSYFYPDRALDRKALAKSLVTVLGYACTTDQYVVKANQLGLFMGVQTKDEAMTRGDVAMAVYNALRTDMMKAGSLSYSEGSVYKNNKISGTLMQEFFSVYEASGQITALKGIDLTASGSVEEDVLKIDNRVFDWDESLKLDKKMLAKDITYFYRASENAEKPVLLYCYESQENKVYYAEAENIVYDQCSTVRLSYYENDKKKNVSIPTSAKFIVNGGIIADAEKSDTLFRINSGYAELVIPESGKNPIVWIESYQYYLVDSAGLDAVYLKSGGEINVSEDDDDLEIKIYSSGGEAVTVNEIVSDSAIALGEVTTPDGVLHRNIYILKSVTGAVNAVKEKQYEIDGVTYKALAGLPEVKKGFSYTFYLGMNDEICLVDVDSIEAVNYGYLIDIAWIQDGLGGQIKAKLLEANGDKVEYDFGDKFYINDKKVKTASAANDDSFKLLYDSAAKRAKRQVVGYTLSRIGTLSRIYTAEEGSEVLSLDVDPGSKLQCKSSSLFNFGGQLTAKSDGAIFVIPQDADTADEDDFEVWDRSYFTNDASYLVQGYNVDDLCEADVIVVIADSTDTANYNEGNTYTCIFDYKESVLNDEGEIVDQITYWQRGVQYTKMVADRTGKSTYQATMEALAGIKHGDLFKIELTADNGMIKNASVEFEAENRSETNGTYNAARLIFYGKVIAVSNESIRIQKFATGAADYLASTKYLFKNASRVTTYLYKGADRDIEYLPNCLADVRVGDWVVLQARNAASRTLVIFRDDDRLPNGKLK